MSANGTRKPPSPIRQFSLNGNQPLRRKMLKKQFSEDIPDSKEKWIPELGFHVSLCTTTQMKALDRPPPAKQAWIDKREEIIDKTEEGIVAKKCKEIKRPTTAKLVKQTSLNKESILLSHQQLAERLRQAWKDREKGKQNLNIFLAHNVKEKQDDEFLNDVIDPEQGGLINNNESVFEKSTKAPKIIRPLNPEAFTNSEVNYKHIFQKRMRRAHSVEEPLKDLVYCPARPLDTKNKTVVVVPLAPENLKPDPHEIKKEIPIPKQQQSSFTKEEPNDGLQKEQKLSDNHVVEEKPIDVIIRPMTAACKREGFRSRNNSAFNGSLSKENQRPPLVRASSVPLKPTQPKPKFIAQKRRIKSATKSKKDKNEKSSGEDDEKDGKGKNKKFQRCVSVSGTDVVTMVSLLSPDESEVEEQVETEKEKPKSKTSSPVKNKPEVKEEKVEQPKNYSLRKAVKSVTFQQSTIHAVRSFSASFPARRGSVAAALMLNSNGGGIINKPNNEKRTTENSSEHHGDEDGREPKRRLVRTKSAPQAQCSFEDKEAEASVNNEFNEEPTKNVCTTKAPLERSTSLKPEEKEGTQENPNTEPSFDTPKEKQCWDMYCKMSKKGINVSFDTILRGMLTPTEYRLRRKSVAAMQSFDENNPDATTS